MPTDRFRRELAGALAGMLAGFAAALAFSAAHAAIIIPIWNRMGFGIASAVVAGAACGWAFVAVHADAIECTEMRLVHGVRFGFLLWIAVAPVTAVDAVLRATGLAPRFELLAVAVAVVTAIGCGATLGWRIRRNRRGAVAGAAATMLLTVAMAGPVPVANSARAMGIFLAVLPSTMIAGAVLAALMPTVHARLGRAPIAGE